MQLLNDLWKSVPFRFMTTILASFFTFTVFIGTLVVIFGLLIENFYQTSEFNIFLFLIAVFLLHVATFYFALYFGAAYILLVENAIEKRIFLYVMIHFSIGFLMSPILAYNRLVNLHDPKGILFAITAFLNIVWCCMHISKLYNFKYGKGHFNW